MASASFGRKGVSTANIAEPARRRSFGQAQAGADPLAARRDAFLAAERARAADAGPGDAARMPVAADHGRTVLVGGRSLGTAYLLWFFLGGLSAHRFYLGAPLTAIAQVSLWYVSLMFFMAGTSGAGWLVVLGWLWILGDAFLIPGLRNAANEKIRQRAERLLEPVSSSPPEQ